MAITFGALTLPDGLIWVDEFAWSPVVQKTDYSLSGALILQEATRLAGRPITLIGQSSGHQSAACWITRADLLTLQAALQTVGAEFTLTLHDARTFTVAPRQDPLEAEARPVVGSFLPAHPGNDAWYWLKQIKLQTV
ncbi:MAG: hypothetical protein H6974_12310 [Gammaproteobacteria bacterium]|nr:hypothetical protein [Gammaproteobacteria bacterium]